MHTLRNKTFLFIIHIIYLLPAGAFMFPRAVSAQTDLLSPIAANVLQLAQLTVTIVFVLAIVVFGWGIVKFIAAAGNPDEIKKAKSFLVWGVVGMMVGASIFGLVDFIQRYFGIEPGRLIITPPEVRR